MNENELIAAMKRFGYDFLYRNYFYVFDDIGEGERMYFKNLKEIQDFVDDLIEETRRYK